jgi:peptidoglycan hydrolase-like protein with peptidoglycan-binding domain
MALAVPALSIPLSGVHVAWAYAPPAPPSKTLPAALDVAVPYQGQTICDPRPRPGTLAFAQLMVAHYQMGSTSLIGRTCSSGASEHYDGRAWDWMLNINNADQYAVATSVLKWLTAPDAQGRQGAMARRFGIMYVIYNRKMWRAYAPERGWTDYSGVSPHTDHIHFSFTYDGAAKRTSWWTGVATTTYLTTLPPAVGTTTPVVTVPSAPTVLSYGMQSEAVRQLQVKLGNLPTTGYFGDQTKARVVEYQRFVGLPQTGVADLKTQEILTHRGWRTITAAYPALSYGTTSAAVKTLQAKLGALPTTGYYGSMTKARVIAYQKFVGLPQTGVADPVTQDRLWVRGWSGTSATTPAPSPTAYVTLSYGMTSAAVKTLQTKLGGLPVTGYFGSLTKARVTAYQKFVGLPQTGIADATTQLLLYTRGWSTTTYPTLSYGMTSPAVTTLQTKLGGLPVTGYFGPLTEARVIAYQRFVGLAQTGIADATTQQLLYTRGWSTASPASLTAPAAAITTLMTHGEAEVMTAQLNSESPGASAAIATVSTTTAYTAHKDAVLAEGARGASVRELQRAVGGIAVDGVFGAVTRERVTALQRSHALPQTGIVTPEVWELLEQRDFPFVGHRSTVLRVGDTGETVAAIQRLLGVADTGIYDLATREAVKTAQARAGLASTGVVASRTWSLFDRLSA